MRAKIFGALLACSFAMPSVVPAQSLDKEMASLAATLSKALTAQGSKNVAAIDFTDLQGQPTELGRFLSERLTAAMASAAGLSIIDRANIKSILAEHKLTEQGLVDPANAKKLGGFAGVDAILTGIVTVLDDGIGLTVKAISTDSTKVVAVGNASFPKTSEVLLLSNRGISSSIGAPATGSGTTYRDASLIATKDIGSLRVVLKSVLPMKVKDHLGRTVNGLRCSFEFINRETQRPIAVAMNAEPYRPGEQLGDVLRTTLVDDRGTVWRLSATGLTGIGPVAVGLLSGNIYGGPVTRFQTPAEIGSALQRRDDTGTDVDAVGEYRDFKYQFVLGSTIQVSPGQSVTVAMNFVQDSGENSVSSTPSFFQISGEIVVGIPTSGSRRSYVLHNLTFDRVSMPGGGGR